MINHDLTVDKFFVRNDLGETVADIAKLRQQKINRESYFRPSNWPLVNANNVKEGSCFVDYFVPTASFSFSNDSKGAVGMVVPTTLDLHTYTQLVHEEIKQTIDDIYAKHAEVTLCLSGGIDSMTLLSYIMAGKYLARTNIICFENNTQPKTVGLRQDTTYRQRITELIHALSPELKSMTWLIVDELDLAYSFNHQRFENLRCYATNSVLRRYNDQAFLFGWHGNQILLHHRVFIDEIILKGSVTTAQVSDYLQTHQDFYVTSIANYNINKQKISIEQIHYLRKPWSLLDGLNGNYIYSPLGTYRTFDLLRSLNFSNLSIDLIADARLARTLIAENVNDFLDPYITCEGIQDGDNLQDTLVPMQYLDHSLLVLPDNLNHDLEGSEYIQHEIQQAKKSGFLPVNSMTSIKMLHHMASL
jgi:hypothetical protein